MSPHPNPFWLKTFGGVELEGPEGPVVGRAVQRHRLALLSVLAVAGQRGVARERVITLLWEDADGERGRRLLSDSIYRINQGLGREAIVTVGDTLRLDATVIASDVGAFADAVARGDREEAVALQASPFLEGFFLQGAVDFDRWSDTQRQRLIRERCKALEELAIACEPHDPVQAARWSVALAESDPYSSRVALRLMKNLEAAGDPAGALRHAEYHARLVREDLGLEPDPEVPRYAERLRARPRVEQPSQRSDRGERVIPEGRRAQASPPAPGTPTLPAGPGSVRWRYALPAAAAVAVALLTTLLAWAVLQPGRAALPPPPVDGASLVVLPFADLSASGADEVLADGITEEIIGRLANLDDIRVVGRTTSFAFKGRAVDARELGATLGVAAVLDGSVRRAGDRIRITAQLVDASTGFELWSETLEQASSDVLATQDSIARAVVRRLAGAGAVTVGAPSPPVDAATYNLYLQGRFQWHRRTEASLRSAVRYFERAVEQAPEYARAHAGLGDAYAVLGFYDHLPPREAFPRAEAEARRAIELDATLAAPHATLGYVHLYYGWAGSAAEAEFRRAIDLAPAYSTAHQWYANLLTAQGRFDEAVREMRLATELDPLSLIANTALGWVHYYRGDYSAALEQLDHTRELDPDFQLAYLWAGLTLEEMGRTEESLTELRRAEGFSENALARAALARGLALAGRVDESRTLLARLERDTASAYAPSYEIAKVHEALGDRAEAMRWLTRALDERSHSMVFLMVDPQLARLRSDAAFQELGRRVAFVGS